MVMGDDHVDSGADGGNHSDSDGSDDSIERG